MNHDGDDENEDANEDDPEDKELSDKKDETTDDKNGERKSRGLTGFFKKLGSKKSSSDDGAKNETNANLSLAPETENETDDENHEIDYDKETGEEEGSKKRVSFFQKIGLKKKSSETSSSTNVEQKEDDESSNIRYYFSCVLDVLILC